MFGVRCVSSSDAGCVCFEREALRRRKRGRRGRARGAVAERGAEFAIARAEEGGAGRFGLFRCVSVRK